MTIKDAIKHFITRELIQDGTGGEISDTHPLIEQGIIDSFGIMSLLGFLEERFSVQIQSEELMPEHFESIATIADLVSSKANMPAGAGPWIFPFPRSRPICARP